MDWGRGFECSKSDQCESVPVISAHGNGCHMWSLCTSRIVKLWGLTTNKFKGIIAMWLCNTCWTCSFYITSKMSMYNRYSRSGRYGKERDTRYFPSKVSTNFSKWSHTFPKNRMISCAFHQNSALISYHETAQTFQSAHLYLILLSEGVLTLYPPQVMVTFKRNLPATIAQKRLCKLPAKLFFLLILKRLTLSLA